MKPGERMEIALWLGGGESPEHIRQFIADAKQVMTDKATKAKFMIGPLEFTVKLPGEERVPPVPKWLESKCISEGRQTVELSLIEGRPETYVVPALLVAEAAVLAPLPQFNKRAFVSDLSAKDLRRLRQITKSKAGRPMTDLEADEIIEQVGPGAGFDAVLTGTRH